MLYEASRVRDYSFRSKITLGLEVGSLIAGVLDQMQNCGFTPSVIEEAIQNGTSVPNKVVGRMQFYDSANNILVITEDGKVVTVMYGRPN